MERDLAYPSRPRQVISEARQRMTGRKLATMLVVAAIHVGAVFALLRAFDIDVVPDVVKSMTSFSIPLEPPKPPEPEPSETAKVVPQNPAGEKAARAEPKPISAPKTRIPKKTTPVPPVTGQGNEARSGASDGGAGTGGGGTGLGSGSGGSGGGGAAARHAEKTSGEIRARDYPRASATDRNGAYVIVHFTVTADGSVRDCRVARSSGNPEVDRITCQLAVERFRYRPAVDANGNPVSEKVGWKQWWWQ